MNLNPYRTFDKEPKSKMTLKEFKDRFHAIGGMVAMSLACLVLACGVFMILYGIAYLSFADKTNRYCFVNAAEEQEINQVVLRANRGWGFDVKIGVFSTHDEALETANKLNCEMR